MKKFNTFFSIGIIVVFLLDVFSLLSIPFIYTNKNLVSLLIAYVILVIWFSCHVIYGFNLEENSVEKMQKHKHYAYITFFVTPLILGWMLASLLPIGANILSSNTVVREYRFVKTESRVKNSMSKVFATDRAKKPITFVISNYELQKLNLQEGKNFLVKGRSSYFGLVIDEMNDVELE